ncbi:PREDICTED: EF-hand calcium-binding domain-containing protein 11 [Elephantulus edwardii]|uniref:EF-hand calcium-binding domain-containing protein 11 n=1 Tax=Elephantulus edwardii TaxID=28737 RepID=UPI0003F06DCC|nr:PREDICTED: EF-hand calcium-binding domain-containing protein 11 [Elephantulus edwardii]
MRPKECRDGLSLAPAYVRLRLRAVQTLDVTARASRPRPFPFREVRFWALMSVLLGGTRLWTSETDPSEHRKWVEVFKTCDEDNKGYLSREDFKVAIVMLFGYKPSKIEADSVMSPINENTLGISLEDFLNVVRRKKQMQLPWSEVRHVFTAFDRHYRGFLTLEDFKKAFKQVAPRLSGRIVLEVFREVDQDSDGHVSFKDFEYAMNYGQSET